MIEKKSIPLVIGLTGTRSVGKDTLFKLLRERNCNFNRFAFADALKNDLVPLVQSKFGFDVWNCTAEEKEIIRPILIAYGCAQRAVQADYWAKRVTNDIKRMWNGRIQDFIPVVTDVRFENEVEVLLQDFGAAFVLVNISRIGAPPPTDEEEKHYRRVAKLANFSIEWGNDTLESQCKHVDRLMEHIKAKLP